MRPRGRGRPPGSGADDVVFRIHGVLRARSRSGFGDDINGPTFLLASCALLPTERAAHAATLFEQEIQPLNVAATTEWRLYSQLDLVFLITHDLLREAFGTTAPDVLQPEGTRGFAYRTTRDSGASVFILRGRDEQALADVVCAFARQSALKASGLLLTADWGRAPSLAPDASEANGHPGHISAASEM